MRNVFEHKKPIVYLITKGNLTANNYKIESKKTLDLIKTASELNITLIQIREKKLPANLILDLTKRALKYAVKTDTKIFVNERFDIALAANADGVHLTSNSIPTDLVRNKTKQNFLIGVSTHTLVEARNAKDFGADFVTYSPIFNTNSKVNYGKPKGLENLQDVCKNLDTFPVLALGGINKDNFKETIEVGASGFAGISFLNNQNTLCNILK